MNFCKSLHILVAQSVAHGRKYRRHFAELLSGRTNIPVPSTYLHLKRLIFTTYDYQTYRDEDAPACQSKLLRKFWPSL